MKAPKRRTARLIGLLTIGCLFSQGAFAVEEGQMKEIPQASGTSSSSRVGKMPSPEEARQMMEQMMGGLMGQMIEGMAKSMAKPEVAENLATFSRNYYNALVKQGFTEEEAMKIVTSSGIPSLGGKR